MQINRPITAKVHGRPTESGQAIVLIVLAIIGLFGLTALAIDGGNAFSDHHRAQTAADAAALAGALARIEGGNWRAEALESAKANGYDNNGTTNTVELNTPPINGPYAGDSQYIQVVVTSHLKTYLAVVVGLPEITIVAEAISQSKPAVYGPMFDGYAVVSLAPHSKCDVKESFLIQGEATLDITGGGIFINSDNPKCAFRSFGNGSVRIRDNSPFTIVGGASIQKPQLLTPFPPQVGGPPMAYPPAFQMPKAGCGSKLAQIDEENGKMSAGNWDDDFPPEGVTTLESGVYCIGGNVIVEENLKGDGVVLVVDGSVFFSGDAEIRLSAPKSGPLAGLLLYMAIGNHKRLVLNGNRNSSFQGAILAPGAEVHINGNDSNFGFHCQIIGYTINVDGQSNIVVKYIDEQNYDSYKMPEVMLVQ